MSWIRLNIVLAWEVVSGRGSFPLSVNPSLWSRLKHLNSYQMDSHEPCAHGSLRMNPNDSNPPLTSPAPPHEADICDVSYSVVDYWLDYPEMWCCCSLHGSRCLLQNFKPVKSMLLPFAATAIDMCSAQCSPDFNVLGLWLGRRQYVTPWGR